jgi:hypothetical protein
MRNEHTDVVVFSTRNHSRDVFRSLGYEYEDAITSEFHDGRMIEPNISEIGAASFRARVWAERYRIDRFLPFGTGRGGVRDWTSGLFFVAPASLSDLVELQTIRHWRERTHVAVCHLQELWAAEIPRNMDWLRPILNCFDHVICAQYDTVEPLQRELDAPVSYLPLGVDAESLCPWPNPPSRVIDACAIGAMSPVTHEALWKWSRQTRRYYDFTTTGAGTSFSSSHAHHRHALAQKLQRSRYFFAFRAKRAFDGQRKSQDEFGPRYFEGAAAGAVLIGDPLPGNPAYVEHLDWDGSVIEAGFEDATIPAIIEDLDSRTETVAEIRRANVLNCLTRHDHVHRWEATLALAGLTPTAAMKARRSRLEALAAQVIPDVHDLKATAR